MEERMIDGEEPIGEVDELAIDFPEEYDEGLVGLTPEQLEREKARREALAREAKERHDELVKEGNARLSAEEWEDAEAFFSQALLYQEESLEASQGLWLARTQNFTQTEPFYDEDYALEVAQSTEEVRTFILEQVGEKLEAQRKALQEEATPLREKVEAGQSARRGAFVANRNYYLVRTAICFVCVVLLIVGAIVSATYLTRTRTNVPIIMLGCLAGVAVVCLVITLVFLRKFLLANGLCRANERLSSTEEGARLAEMEKKISCLDDVLDGIDYEEE